jgi:nucleotide-binding universal stress UspA family protein
VKVVVGVRADDPGDDALACAEALSRSMRAVLVLVHVRPAPWRSGGDDAVDAEWRAYLAEQSRTTLARARRRLAPTTEHELHEHTGTSPGRALGEVADAVGASLVVVGSG